MNSAKSANFATQTLVIVPVKILVLAKSRLGTLLTSKQRCTLALNLLITTLTTLLAVFSNVAIITSDPLIIKIAETWGITILPEAIYSSSSNVSLNKILQQTLQNLEIAPVIKQVLILPSDLPFLTQTDLRELNFLADGEVCVLVPDKQQRGTNGLLLPVNYARTFEFSFGTDSFKIHLEKLAKLPLTTRIFQPPGLVFDLDSPTDFAELPLSLQQTLLTDSTSYLFTKISTFTN